MPSSTNKLQWCRLHFVDGIGISNFEERPTRFSPDFNWNLHRSCLLATGDIAIKHQLRFDAISFVCVHKTTEKFISVVYLSFVVRCIYCWWNDGDIFSISSRLVFGFTTATVQMRVRVYNVLSRRSNLRMRVAQMSRTMLSYGVRVFSNCHTACYAVLTAPSLLFAYYDTIAWCCSKPR